MQVFYYSKGYPTNSVNPTLDSYLANKPPPPPIQTVSNLLSKIHVKSTKIPI